MENPETGKTHRKEEDAYNWWLSDVTVSDIVDFTKKYVQLS